MNMHLNIKEIQNIIKKDTEKFDEKFNIFNYFNWLHENEQYNNTIDYKIVVLITTYNYFFLI